MKKLGPIILGFIIGAVLTYYFCPRQIDDMHGMGAEISIPKDTISVAEATRYSKNWEQRNATEIDSTIEVAGPRKKTRSVAWSLDEVHTYIKYAKAKSDSLGYKMTGIRVYLGNYGENAKPKKKNRNTMFIVPTGNKSISKASNFNVSLRKGDEDIPAPPLNEGQGDDGGYP